MDPVPRYLAWAVDGVDEKSLRLLCGVDRVAGDRCWVDGVERPDRLARVALERLSESGPVDRMLGADFATILPHDLLVKMAH